MATPEQWRQYHADKDRYDRALVEYHARLQEWNSLTPEEREGRNREAEDVSRFAWSLGVAALVCWALYEHMRPTYSGDRFWLMWSGVSVLVVLIAAFSSRVLGLLARATVISAIVWVVCSLVFDKMQEKIADPPSDEFQYWATGLVAALTFIVVLLGGGRASAEPRAPSAPNRPI